MTQISEKYILDHFSEALEQGYIQAFFQPIFRSVTERICCAEALARWYDPVYGLLPPASFIHVLEGNDLIYELDMEILRQTCLCYLETAARGTPLQVFSVNLSRYDFRQKDLFDRVSACVRACGVPPEALRLEITESVMLEDIETFQRIFRQFHEAGFSIWIDDFGSGYSSLNVLQNYEFDTMKFDMLFLKNFSARGRQVLASLINMAKTMKIHSLVEGVETEEQKEFLRDIGCEALQGYYYTRPLPKEELLALAERDGALFESREEDEYWNRIGRLNFLSPSPLADFGHAEGEAAGSPENNIVPLALAESTADSLRYVYVNEAYRRNARAFGYDSIEALERSFNEKKHNQYLLIKKLVFDAVSLNTVQELDYRDNDIYYSMKAVCVARMEDRAMLALHLRIFDTEREIKTAKEMLQYGSALFSTYEIVTLVYPERGASTRIYAANNIPPYDNIRASTLEESIRKFCEAEIIPADQERYMHFFDISTISRRIGASPRGFIQAAFRLRRTKKKENRWRNIRISRVPSDGETMLIYTIQVVHDKAAAMLDIMAAEHPELLEL